MLKLWCPAQLPLVSGCQNSGGQVRPPPHFPHSPLHRSGLYIYIGSALWNIRRILRPAPIGLRYHRALCLWRRDDQIRRISQASNFKKPARFTVTPWIVGSDEGHDSAIRSVCLFCHRRVTSATLCQHAKYKKKTFLMSAKIGFLQHFFNDKTSLWLFGGKRLIAKLARGNFYTFWSSQFFSNCSFEWKRDKIYLPTINQWYMFCLQSLDH